MPSIAGSLVFNCRLLQLPAGRRYCANRVLENHGFNVISAFQHDAVLIELPECADQLDAVDQKHSDRLTQVRLQEGVLEPIRVPLRLFRIPVRDSFGDGRGVDSLDSLGGFSCLVILQLL